MAALDWLFRNRATGRITVAQAPNLSLGLFLVAAVVRALCGGAPQLLRISSDVAVVALLWWSLDEVVRGVNPWRRLLGAAVLAVELAALATR